MSYPEALPSQALTKYYQNEHVLLAKQADAPSFLLRTTYGAILGGREREEAEERARRKAEYMALAEALREAEAARVAHTIRQSMEHPHMPIILREHAPAGYLSSDSVPLGLDSGMVRIAHAIGADMAGMSKEALPLASPATKRLTEAAAGGIVKPPKQPLFNFGANKRFSTAGAAEGIEVGAPKQPGLLTKAFKPNDAKMMKADAAMPTTPAAAKPVTPPVPGGAPAAAATAPTAPAAGSTPYRSAPEPHPAPAAAAATPPPAPGPAAQPSAEAAPAAEAAKPAAEAGKPGFIDRVKQEYSSGRLGKSIVPLALMGGAAYGGYKLLNKGMDIMSREPTGTDRYGYGSPQVPYGINQYGQPQM